ncbi:lipopolysaccharide biosynthesis protein [Pedobacter psychroterrae]|uniref:Polysaccharide biosynthesis protein n=1 Tax=Pedobacter psychroterrae TaxID=2530453 RepID=A0A4R0NR41_9SPHI|nr:polysaccharide biosynthesis C-terminal domain-containing protein [Pedobacter psychroterrae]TCD02639.1 polysaccharide biosynthesis protein [Pedobacter psychroterrae]
MSVLKKFMGQTAIYGVSTVLSRLFGFILTPIYTRAYGSATYGILTKLFAYASLINAVLAFGMESTYFRYLNKHEDKKQEVYNNSFLCIAGIATLFLLTGLVFRNSIAAYLTSDPAQLNDYKNYVSCFIWILFVDAICVIPFARLRAEDRAVKYSIIKFSNIGIFVAFNLLFIKAVPAMAANDWPLAGWMSAWYKTEWVGYVFISNLIASLATFLMLLPEFLKLQLRFDKELFAKMFTYSWPVLVANLSFIVNENLDKIALSELLPVAIADRDVGIYGAVCKIAIFMSIFITAFRLGAEPFFFSHAKNENAKNTYALILRYFVIALTLIFVGLVANIEILKYFISRDAEHIAEYWVGLPAVPYLLFGYVCLGIYSNLAIWYRLSDQTRYGLYISLVGAAVTIGLNFVLIPRYSYMGSAWVSMLAYFVMMVISYVLGQRHYPIPYELKRISAYLLVSVVLVVLSFWVFKRNIYIGNILLLVFTAGVFYFEKDQLKLILKKK